MRIGSSARTRYGIGALLFAAALIWGIIWLAGEQTEQASPSIAVAEALATDTTGYARAEHPRRFRFPADHGPHPAYKTEWWYYTGNLSTTGGRRFGYQLTFFRIALAPNDSARYDEVDSTWSTRQIYMAHFALTDVARGEFNAYERFGRGAAGLAGARSDPYRVWLDDWEASGPNADSVHIIARAGGVGIDLRLRRERPIVLQGDAGLDVKGRHPGNASYYYSMTRMTTAGYVQVGGTRLNVSGLSWMDREWSTSALDPDQVGWDWFSLHLDSGRDLMFYRLRETDGDASPFSSGIIVEPDGRVRRLGVDDVSLRVLDRWRSPESGNEYPIAWQVKVPDSDIDLRVEAYIPDQELIHTVTYWEGAVAVTGSDSGSGYVELTGYGESEPSRMPR